MNRESSPQNKKPQRLSEQKFFDFLESKKYPRNHLIQEPVNNTTRDVKSYEWADVGVIDNLENSKYIAFFEVIGYNVEAIIKTQLHERLKEQHINAKSVGIPFFIVCIGNLKNEANDFKLYSFDENFNPSLLEDVPSFESLKTKGKIRENEELDKNRKNTFSGFQGKSYILAYFSFCLIALDFILSFFGVALITTERMIIFGIGAALLIIPYSQQFKILGIEWEKAKNENKQV